MIGPRTKSACVFTHTTLSPGQVRLAGGCCTGVCANAGAPNFLWTCRIALRSAPIPPLYIGEVQRFYDLLQEYINWVYRSLFGLPYPINAVDTSGADELLRTIHRHAI